MIGWAWEGWLERASYSAPRAIGRSWGRRREPGNSISQLQYLKLNYDDWISLSKFEISKKRDAELAKLRKLLEDVHLESEETAHMLRKKHQEAVVDLQDQLELMAKSKVK